MRIIGKKISIGTPCLEEGFTVTKVTLLLYGEWHLIGNTEYGEEEEFLIPNKKFHDFLNGVDIVWEDYHGYMYSAFL
jgi:hypothetical protein